MHAKIMGIDLGVRVTGLALLHGSRILLSETPTSMIKPPPGTSLAGIDAPLTRVEAPFRKMEVLMWKLGLKPLPPGFKGMRMLTIMGQHLKRTLEERGITVLETHPDSTYRMLGVHRGVFHNYLRERGFVVKGSVTRHTTDAAAAAYTALLAAEGCSVLLISSGNLLAIPAKNAECPV